MIVKGRNVSPATAALACRIYGHCAPGWGHTYAEVAEALGVSAQRVRAVAVSVGWNGRFTFVSTSAQEYLWSKRATHGGLFPTSADFEPFRRMAAMAVDEE